MSWFAFSAEHSTTRPDFSDAIGRPVSRTSRVTIRSANGTARRGPGYACCPAVCKDRESRGLAGSGVDMGMRSRVKGFAKRLLGRGESTPASAPPPPRTAAPAPPAAAPAPRIRPAPKPAAPEPVEPRRRSRPAPAPKRPFPSGGSRGSAQRDAGCQRQPSPAHPRPHPRPSPSRPQAPMTLLPPRQRPRPEPSPERRSCRRTARRAAPRASETGFARTATLAAGNAAPPGERAPSGSALSCDRRCRYSGPCATWLPQAQRTRQTRRHPERSARQKVLPIHGQQAPEPPVRVDHSLCRPTCLL